MIYICSIFSVRKIQHYFLREKNEESVEYSVDVDVCSLFVPVTVFYY